MIITDITEPIPGLKENEEKVIGIDLGTTNSLVATVDNGIPTIIGDILPSIVSYQSTGDIIVGKEQGEIIIKSIKRLMGKSISEVTKINNIFLFPLKEDVEQGIVKFDILGKTLTPVEISAEILKQLKKSAEEYWGQPVNKAVITVPAYFDDSSRAATRDAAKLAGLEILRLINEPTAAALSYGLDNKNEGKYLIYDLGGGTFDVSLLNLTKGVLQVLATGGDNKLGGDDIDQLLLDYFLKQDQYKQLLNQLDKDLLRDCLNKTKFLKEQLTDNISASTRLKVGVQNYDFILTREQFDHLIKPLVKKTIFIVKNVLEDAGVAINNLKGIVLVGGSTRVKLIKEELANALNQKPLDHLDPDKIVALGASLQAERLVRGDNEILIDVNALSLGIEVVGGLSEKLIARNTPIPVSVEQEFTTYQDGQTSMSIHVVQGERELAKDCRSLANFKVNEIPPMKAGLARVKISFTLDADGLLTVSAYEKNSGKLQQIEVKPSYGLTGLEVENMLKEALENASIDEKQKLLIQTKSEANQIINSLEISMKEDPELLSLHEETLIKDLLLQLKNVLKNEDRKKILCKISELEQNTGVFVSKKMNKHLFHKLRGQNVHEVEVMLEEQN